jgi:hypothetical protein
MKISMIASVCAASIIVSVACTSGAPGSGPDNEKVGQSSAALDGVGCTTVGLTTTGGSATNEGASFSGITFSNCINSGVTFPSTASYPGVANGPNSCPNAAILEVTNWKGMVPWFALDFPLHTGPNDEGDCEATEVQATVWGSNGGAWTDLGDHVQFGTWEQVGSEGGLCLFNPAVGGTEWQVAPGASWANYTKFRLVANATETTNLKGTPDVTYYAVNLSAFASCVE